MKTNTIELKNYYKVAGGKLHEYVCELPFDVQDEHWKRPAVIVCPGGAYAMTSKREWEPVAMQFVALGFNVFVLDYLCQPQGVKYPEQLLEFACAVDYVKQNADSYHVNANEVFAVGFSAGGHLVANLSVNNGTVEKYYDGKLNYRLTASCLGYPVISAEYGHTGSHVNLLGGLDNKDLVCETALDKQVNANTGPSFIWSTSQDNAVPCVNALQYAKALADNNVLFELHVYPQGVHGLSTCDCEINSQQDYLPRYKSWLTDCASFFRLFCVEKY